MRHMRHNLIILIILITVSGCATLISGSNQQIDVSTSGGSKPVYVNGVFQDSTPCRIKVKRSVTKEKVVTIGRSDSAKVVRLRKKYNRVSTINFIILPGWIIDLLTGAVVKYENYEIEE